MAETRLISLNDNWLYFNSKCNKYLKLINMKGFCYTKRLNNYGFRLLTMIYYEKRG